MSESEPRITAIMIDPYMPHGGASSWFRIAAPAEHDASALGATGDSAAGVVVV